MKNILAIAAVFLLVVGGVYFFTRDDSGTNDQNPDLELNEVNENANVDVNSETEPPAEVEEMNPTSTVLGESVEGNTITAYHFGTGDTELMFIGGIHGGYSWNTALLGYELIDWFNENEENIPENIKVTIVPVLNPDGLETVTGSTGLFAAADVSGDEETRISGRFNANDVDLNRNFDCQWQPNATWQSRSVSGGTAAFSEPESQAIRSYVTANSPEAVVAWYSSAGGVYASSCTGEPSTESIALTNLFAEASGYSAHSEYDYYEITGDMVNWMAGQNIPAISVLLSNHTQTEFSKNQAGVEALLEYYAE